MTDDSWLYRHSPPPRCSADEERDLDGTCANCGDSRETPQGTAHD